MLRAGRAVPHNGPYHEYEEDETSSLKEKRHRRVGQSSVDLATSNIFASSRNYHGVEMNSCIDVLSLPESSQNLVAR